MTALPGELSARQVRIIAAIRESYHQNNQAPSFRDLIGPATGLKSTGAIEYQVKKLEAAGLVRRRGNRQRLELILQPGDPCPCCGRPV